MIKSKLFAHQTKCVEFALNKDKVVYWLGIGGGKSLTSLATIDMWGSNKILIVCPTSVITTWKQELSKHTDFSYIELTGTTKERLDKFNNSNAKVHIINWPGLKYLFGTRVKGGYELDVDTLSNAYYDCIILDECHNCMNYKALQSKIVKVLSKITQKCIMLTGSPISGNELDLWNQYSILDDGKTLGSNFFAFRNKYFDSKLHKTRNRVWKEWTIKGDNAREEILSRLSTTTIRFDLKECVDLPEVTREERYIELTKHQKDVIDEIHNDILCIKKDEFQEIKNKAIKIAQVSGGTLLENNEIYVFPKNPKLLELEDILKETDEKVIVFHAFVGEGREIEDLCYKNNWGYSSLRSEIKNKEEQIEKFQNDPDIKVCIAHPQSGGEGLNLQMARIGIFYSLGFTGHLKRQQAEGRIYRMGQNKNVVFIDLIAKDCLDEHILEVQKKKKDISDAIVNYLG